MTCIDCKKYADEIIDEVARIPDKTKALLVLTAGDDLASAAYMRGKQADCKRCGIPFHMIRVRNQQELLSVIIGANADDDIGGIIVQLPLPEGFDADVAISLITPSKDVDGFRPDSPFRPCTPEGILHILDREVGDLAGKSVLLIGKGKLVGRPLIDLLLDRGATLTIAHSRTADLRCELWTPHHIIITAAGRPHLVSLYNADADIVIDAGINRDENGKLCGDCYDFTDERYPAMRVTPVPGGVGLMTRAMLMKHMGEVNRA